MKKILFYLVALFLITSTSCKKNSASSSNPNSGKPVQTQAGTATGTAVSKDIGQGGGSIISADGSVELIFPANALASSTTITIQPITNACPGSMISYRFSPDGSKFNQPVTLKFHYTDGDLTSTIADLMGIAFQGNSGAWYRLKNFSNDPGAKVIQASITHFTDYTFFSILRIIPATDTIPPKANLGLIVEASLSDDDLPPLPVAGQDPINYAEAQPIIYAAGTCKWSINGNAEVSTDNGSGKIISGNGTLAVAYQAPDKAPAANPVAISADIDLGGFTYHGKKFNKTTVVSNILIKEVKFNYTVKIDYSDSTVASFIGPVYTDGAKFDIEIKIELPDIVHGTYSNLHNDSAIVVPNDHVYSTTRFIFNTGTYGVINITDISFNPLMSTDSIVQINLTHTGTQYPGLKTLNPTDGTIYTDGPPTAIPGAPMTLELDLKAKSQIDLSQGPHMTVTMTRN